MAPTTVSTNTNISVDIARLSRRLFSLFTRALNKIPNRIPLGIGMCFCFSGMAELRRLRVTPHVEFYSGLRGGFCLLQYGFGYGLGVIGLAAVLANLSRCVADDDGRMSALQCDCGNARFRFAMFADGAFHDFFLNVKVGSHCAGSGSYAVMMIRSPSVALSATTTCNGRAPA